MKTFAKRYPSGKPNKGYLAPCQECGEIVVHSESTDKPFHMHYYSAKCKKLASTRKKRGI